ncbi:MAG TPA: 1,4-alpha-glucan branching protein GlgB [Pirellulaceae bacterium]|nr:1,4-alpha-glucan branching protein GlgB [Pirellulaceae bacterium]
MFQALLRGELESPRALLGYQATANNRVVRTFAPGAERVWLVDQRSSRRQVMKRIHAEGLFECHCPDSWNDSLAAGDYWIHQLRAGLEHQSIDPYAVSPMLTEFDLHLIGEGRHYRLYDRLGAQLTEVNGVRGVHFSVWAPNARGISVIGTFNDWDGRAFPMQKRASSGIWELFVPGAGQGDHYKYRVTTWGGNQVDKCDPIGFAAEVPPRTASIVADLRAFSWSDEDWMTQRKSFSHDDRPMNIYEVHLGSWRQTDQHEHGWINYRELAHQLVEYCQQMHFTHVELLPVAEHPYTGSWGYQTVGYFAVTSRYGSPADFMYFVNYCHQHGIGVIIDWVPAHFPKDGHGLARFDGTALYEHLDRRKGEHPDWNTYIFNLSRNEVRNFLIANALFWLDHYHIDGLRVDAVASMLYLDYSRKEGEWIPNEYGGKENIESISFLRTVNDKVHEEFPGALMIAEESTAWPGVTQSTAHGGLGFDLKWNMGWMNDTLQYMRNNPVHRRFHHNQLTFSMMYAYSERFLLPFSHDEVVHGKRSLLDQMPGDMWQKFANLRLLFAYQWTHPGKKLIFMGSEFGQWREWNCNQGLDWNLLEYPTHRGVQQLVADLNQLVIQQPALHALDSSNTGFEWIDCHHRELSLLAYERRDTDGNALVVIANFTPVVRQGLRFGVLQAGNYIELLNTDDQAYGGSNVVNSGTISSEPVESHGRPHSICPTLPPLAVIILKLAPISPA